MSLNPSPEERLEILRGADPSRGWGSVDDERVCPRCGKSITGHQIVIRSSRPGRFELHCPTSGCAATIGDCLCPTPFLPRPEQKSGTVIRRVEMDFSHWQ